MAKHFVDTSESLPSGRGKQKPEPLTAKRSPLLVALDDAISRKDCKAFVATVEIARREGALTPALHRKAIFALATQNALGAPETIKAVLGRIPADVDDGMTLVPQWLCPRKQAVKVFELAQLLCNAPIADKTDWLSRFDLSFRRVFIERLISKRLLDPNVRISPEDRLAIRMKRADLRPKPGNIDVIKSHIEAKETVILLRLHAGSAFSPLMPIKKWLEARQVGSGMIGSGATGPTKFNAVAISPKAADFAFQFTRLCKAMKSGQHIIEVFPDGTNGGSFGEMTIGPFKLGVGLGASLLAYYGKARFCFASRKTVNGVSSIEFQSGPKVEDGMSREEVSTLMVNFYRDCIIKILTGDPIDMEPMGSYWPQFGREIEE